MGRAFEALCFLNSWQADPCSTLALWQPHTLWWKVKVLQPQFCTKYMLRTSEFPQRMCIFLPKTGDSLEELQIPTQNLMPALHYHSGRASVRGFNPPPQGKLPGIFLHEQVAGPRNPDHFPGRVLTAKIIWTQTGWPGRPPGTGACLQPSTCRC